MKYEKTGLLTSGNIAKTLGVSDGKMKKAIKDLKIKPEAKKGVCNYYAPGALVKIKAALP